MITISEQVVKRQKNFWNACLFHPTDAVEDSWGKRILDRIAKDGSIHTVRIYTMFEDIVYLDETGTLQYDFRVSDLRLDYLVSKGFNLLLAYAGVPDCIAQQKYGTISAAKKATRYKGKHWNSNPPKDYDLWEEVCYQYTKHNIERYGIETVSKWYCQCFNEPDIFFFMVEVSESPEDELQCRLPEYVKMYEAFQRGVCRASEAIRIGGPAVAHHRDFLGGFLDIVKEKQLKLDFISLHNYGTHPKKINDGSKPICTANNVNRQKAYMEVIASHGFGNVPVLIDEWGMSARGYSNREECPGLMVRETEVFSAYYVKMIYEFIHSNFNVETLALCLSGQHEMTEDFSGFRNFFTLNFIAKPIYNAHILAAKLKENLLASTVDKDNLFVIPTKDDQGRYAILLSYSAEKFEEDIPTIEETVVFEQDIKDKQITLWCIDQNTTNPYKLYQRLGIGEPTAEEIRLLQEEGKLKPVVLDKGTDKITLSLSPNATYLITVEE